MSKFTTLLAIGAMAASLTTATAGSRHCGGGGLFHKARSSAPNCGGRSSNLRQSASNCSRSQDYSLDMSNAAPRFSNSVQYLELEPNYVNLPVVNTAFYPVTYYSMAPVTTNRVVVERSASPRNCGSPANAAQSFGIGQRGWITLLREILDRKNSGGGNGDFDAKLDRFDAQLDRLENVCNERQGDGDSSNDNGNEPSIDNGKLEEISGKLDRIFVLLDNFEGRISKLEGDPENTADERPGMDRSAAPNAGRAAPGPAPSDSPIPPPDQPTR